MQNRGFGMFDRKNLCGAVGEVERIILLIGQWFRKPKSWHSVG